MGARNRTSGFGVIPVDGVVMNVLVVEIEIRHILFSEQTVFSSHNKSV